MLFEMMDIYNKLDQDLFELKQHLINPIVKHDEEIRTLEEKKWKLGKKEGDFFQVQTII